MKRLASLRPFLAVVFIVGGLLLPGGPAAAATQATRTAPYDFGCLERPPCDALQWRQARQGKLYGSEYAYPCVTYSLFIVWPCFGHVGSSTGIYVTTATRGQISLTANVRAVPVVFGRLCMGIDRRSDGGPVFTPECSDVTLIGSQELTTTFEGAILPRGRYLIYVWLADGTGEVVVDSISYQVTP